MKIKLLLVFVITSLVLKVQAQDPKLCLQIGYGFYNMSTFSQLTTLVQNELPFESKVISNYPPYLYYQPMLKFQKKNMDFGLCYMFQTTGARISSADYSGEYAFDSKVNGHSPGIFISGVIKEYSIGRLELSLQTGLTFSTLKMSEYLRIDTIASTTESTFKASSVYCEPGLSYSYNVNRMGFQFNVGYFKEFLRSEYSPEGDGEGSIPVGEKITDNDVWDGFRIGLTFSYLLNKNSSDKN